MLKVQNLLLHIRGQTKPLSVIKGEQLPDFFGEISVVAENLTKKEILGNHEGSSTQ